MNGRTAIFLSLLFAAEASAQTTVCPSGCDYTSIAEGTVNTPQGGTVVVFEGVYSETNIFLGGQFAHVLTSAEPGDPSKVVIDASGDEAFHSFVNGATLVGVTVRNSDTERTGGAIHFTGGSGGSGRIENVVFLDNKTTQNGAAVACFGGNLQIVDTVFEGNRADGGAGAVLVTTGCDSVTVRSSVFKDNRAFGGPGGGISAGGPTVIENSQFLGNRALSSLSRGGGIFLGGTGPHRVEQALLQGNQAVTFGNGNAVGGGIAISDSGPTVTLSGITLSGNLTRDSNDNDLFGGGLYIGRLGGTVDLLGVTAIQNTASQGGGIFCEDPARLGAFDAAAAGNTPDQISGCQQCNAGDTRACDTGLAGLCASGTQTCDEQGHFGECTFTSNSLGIEGFVESEGSGLFGAKGPSGQCTDGTDNDCDGLVDAADPDCKAPSTTTTANAKQSTNAGDPINTLFGELWDRYDPDLDLGGPLPLLFQRYYASALAANGISSALGTNWRHNFDWSATVDAGVSVEILTDEGRRIRFEDEGGTWVLTGSQDIPYQLVTDPDSSELILGDPTTRLLYAFDPSTGLLNTIQDGNLNTLTLSYSGSDLTQVADGLGRTLTFSYAGGLLVSVTGNGGRTVTFAHTGDDLTSVTDVRGNTTSYSYDPGGLMTTMTRPLGNTPLTQSWNAMDQVASQTDADANTTTLAYGSPMVGDTAVTNPDVSSAVHTHSLAGALVNLEDEAEENIAVGNDAQGRRGALVDRKGGVTRQEYDPVSGEPYRRVRADGTERRAGYASYVVRGIEFRRQAAILHPYGALESFGYDAAGNLIRVTDAEGNTTRLTRNDQGLVTSIINPLDAVTTFSYNTDGTRASTTDPAMNTTTFAYDAHRRLNLITFADGSTRAFSHDDADNPLTDTDGRNNTATYTWDANGNLASVIDRAGAATVYSYDGNDRLTGITDALGGTSSVAYDERGNLASITDATGNTTTYGYDVRNRLVSITDGQGSTTTIERDGEGMVVALENPLGQRTDLVADPLGRTTGRTSPLANSTAFDYDPLARSSSVINPEGELRRTRFTFRGELAGIDVGPLSTQLARNELGRVTTLTTPRGTDWLASYHAQGRLSSTTNPLGNTTAYTYDSRNRPDVVTFPGSLGSVNYDFDANGNLTRAAYSDGTLLTASYDAEDRLIGGTNLTLTRDAQGRIIESNGIAYTLDDAGRILTMTYAPGKSVTYGYNGRDQVTSISDWLGNTTTAQYDAAGRLTDIVRPNGVNTRQVWDAEGRLTSLTHGDIVDIRITRDGAGRPVDVTREQPALPNPEAIAELSASYNAADRTESFVYDAAGRLLSDGTRTFTWRNSGRIDTLDEGSGPVAFDADLFGNITQMADGSVTTGFVWGYAQGVPRLLIERANGSDQFFHIVVGSLTLYTIDASNGQLQFHRNENGHVIAMTDESGQVAFSAAYSPTRQAVAGTATSTHKGRAKGGAQDIPLGSRLKGYEVVDVITTIGDELYIRSRLGGINVGFEDYFIRLSPEVYDAATGQNVAGEEKTSDPVPARVPLGTGDSDLDRLARQLFPTAGSPAGIGVFAPEPEPVCSRKKSTDKYLAALAAETSFNEDDRRREIEDRIAKLEAERQALLGSLEERKPRLGDPAADRNAVDLIFGGLFGATTKRPSDPQSGPDVLLASGAILRSRQIDLELEKLREELQELNSVVPEIVGLVVLC